MSKVIVSREARKDLEGIRAYIRDDLANPDATRRIIAVSYTHLDVYKRQAVTFSGVRPDTAAPLVASA